MKKFKSSIATLLTATILASAVCLACNAASPVIFGDTNGDHQINICDLVNADIDKTSTDNNLSADYDCDGSLSDSDISTLRNALLNGTVKELSCNAQDFEDDYVANPQEDTPEAETE